MNFPTNAPCVPCTRPGFAPNALALAQSSTRNPGTAYTADASPVVAQATVQQAAAASAPAPCPCQRRRALHVLAALAIVYLLLRR